jgi:hypothetical protein
MPMTNYNSQEIKVVAPSFENGSDWMFTSRRDTEAITSDGSGEFTINHLMFNTPAAATMATVGDVSYGVQVVSLGSTAITGRLYDLATGADVTSQAATISWAADDPSY